jgi:hypothetical protein
MQGLHHLLQGLHHLMQGLPNLLQGLHHLMQGPHFTTYSRISTTNCRDLTTYCRACTIHTAGSLPHTVPPTTGPSPPTIRVYRAPTATYQNKIRILTCLAFTIMYLCKRIGLSERTEINIKRYKNRIIGSLFFSLNLLDKSFGNVKKHE